MYGNLLIPEPPLQVLPSLAALIGLNESIILQQVHYWTQSNERSKRPDTFQEGYYWTFATFDKSQREGVLSWSDQFPFWNERTIRRAVSRLDEKALLVIGNFNRKPTDRTQWYRVNYPQLRAVSPIRTNCPDASGQVVPLHPDNLSGSIIEETTLRESTSFLHSSEKPNAVRGENLFGEKVSKSKAEAELSGLTALSAFVSVADQMETLVNGFGPASNKVAFLRVAYMQIFGTPEDDTPAYGDIGKLLAKARSLPGITEREAGENIIKQWVAYVSFGHKEPSPLQWLHDRIDAKRQQSRMRRVPTGLILKTHSEAVAYWEKHRYRIDEPFDKFFKRVDSSGRDWSKGTSGNEPPHWKLIATPNQMKPEER